MCNKHPSGNFHCPDKCYNDISKDENITIYEDSAAYRRLTPIRVVCNTCGNEVY
jgi:hypothetical protein